MADEKLLNVPNILSISRIVLTFFVIYMIVTNSDVVSVIVVFGVAALTDWFDGQIARRFNMKTEFGRRIDMIADRFLWGGTAFAFVTVYGFRGFLTPFHGLQLLGIMSREIITLPFALIAFFSGRHLPNVRHVGKVTTFVQGFALPALILSVFYEDFVYASLPLSAFLLVLGVISAIYYIKDIQKSEAGK